VTRRKLGLKKNYPGFFPQLALALLLTLVSAQFLAGCSQEEKSPSPTKAETGPSQGATSAPPAAGQKTDPPVTPSPDASEQTPVALVNGQPISANTLNSQALRLYRESPFGNPEDAKNPLNPPLEIKLEVLDLLIRLEVAYQEAKKAGYEPKPEEVDKILGQIAEAYGGDQNQLRETLTSFGDTMDQLKRQINYTETVKKWRDTEFLSQAMVSEPEAKAYYDGLQDQADHPDQILALQLMFPVPLSATGDQALLRQKVRDQAEAALAELKAGANFEDLAPKYMTPNTRSLTNNGRMGWVAKDGVFPELEEALFQLSPGQISPVIETPFSFHILKALEFRPAGRLTFDDLRPDILDFLTNQKIDLTARARIEELKDQATIQIVDPELAKAWPEFQRRVKNEDSGPESPKPAEEGPTAGQTPPQDAP
jgi:parvulin-like peptidyl-prolyl isomerase